MTTKKTRQGENGFFCCLLYLKKNSVRGSVKLSVNFEHCSKNCTHCKKLAREKTCII